MKRYFLLIGLVFSLFYPLSAIAADFHRVGWIDHYFGWDNDRGDGWSRDRNGDRHNWDRFHDERDEGRHGGYDNDEQRDHDHDYDWHPDDHHDGHHDERHDS